MVTQTALSAGRGWLTPEAAASVARIDNALGHPLQITEAGRTWDQQNKHYQAYKRFLAGGPYAPIALSPNAPSIHQLGNAIDSDEAQKHISLMSEHGWVRTVYRMVNGRYTLVEPWHFEYRINQDRHRNDPVPPPAAATPRKDKDMRLISWNTAVWLVGFETCAYIPDDVALWSAKKVSGTQVEELSNAELTQALFFLGIPWEALDATHRSQAFDNESNWGSGKFWSRQMAEGYEDALRDTSLAKNIDDLSKSVASR